MDEKALLMLAQQAAKNAYAPYSGFLVGAALLCDDGAVYTGCNIENASFGLTNCAERTALFKAVSEGRRSFSALAVVGGNGGVFDAFSLPCGACRQALSEFCDAQFRIILGKDDGSVQHFTLGELLPGAFKLH